MNQIARDYITENNGSFVVHSHSGKGMGSYPTRAEAEKRLSQIEYFKHAGDVLDQVGGDMEPTEMVVLRKLMGKFLGEEAAEPAHQAADAGQKIGAGVVLMAPSGKVLLLLRSAAEKNYGGHWGLPGGKADDGETPEECAARECLEETGIAAAVGPGQLENLGTVTTPNGFEFTTFLARCAGETDATLDGEHDDWAWTDPAQLPEKIHPGVKETLEKLVRQAPGAADAIALDKDTVRTIDDVGRMHVASAHISKATVNPYYGKEIPGWQELGLDPERIYQMFRDPVELEKAAKSFQGIQVLIRHIPVSADDHRPDEIVGTTGTNAVFNAPYLDNELVIWAKPGIDAIESDAQRELSCGYGYTPVMEPGTFEGAPYDGRMTDIKGNHVALVNKGRAGPDVVVGDAALIEQPPKEGSMKMTITAMRLHSALMAGIIAPKIALDQQLKVSTALATSFAAINLGRADLKDPANRTAIVKLARDAAEPALTAEAKKAGGFGPDDVTMRVLDMIDAPVAAEPEDEDPEAKPASEWRKKAMDYFTSKGMDEKGANEACDALDPGMAKAAEDEVDDESAEEKAKREKDDKAKSEKAMDEQIAKSVKTEVDKAVDTERKRSKDAAEARQFVEPWVGKVSLAHDSAEDIYRTTLGMLGVKHEAVREGAALKILVEAQQKPNQRRQQADSFASDAAPPEGKAFSDMFPGAERIGHAA